MVNCLIIVFSLLSLYGFYIGHIGVGLLSVFCALCLYYFDSRLMQRHKAWLKSPAAAKTPASTEKILEEQACECSCRICHPRF